MYYELNLHEEQESDIEMDEDAENENADEYETDDNDELNDDNENVDIYTDEHVWDARVKRFRFRSEVWCSFEDEIYEKEDTTN